MPLSMNHQHVHSKGFTMNAIKSFIAALQEFLNPPRISDLESYILSKNPQTTGDVDFWTAEYDNERRIRSRQIAMQ
jgi:hypothetical protein